MARRNLLDFTRYTFPNYKVNWHHTAICATLDRWAFGDITNLMVFMPPRRGKSELVSRRLPAFIFGHKPNAKMIAASYAATLIESMNRDCQNIIDDEAYAELFPDTYLSGKNVRNLAYGTYLRNSTEFQIVGHTGYYKCAGVGGGLTGRGYEFGIIDDPVKDALEAESAVTRERVWEWYTKVFLTRAAPHAKECVTMTRWHENDLAGRIIQSAMQEDGTKVWHILMFPEMYESAHELFALAQKSPNIIIVGQEYDNRNEGQYLWPSHFPPEHSKQQQQVLGSRGFGSLFQQRPAAAGGDVLKREWLRYYDGSSGLIQKQDMDGNGASEPLDPKAMIKFATVDLATSLKEAADYFVVGFWGATQDGLYLLDLFRDRVGGERLIPILKAGYLRHYPMTYWIEKVGMQLAIIQQAIAAGIPCREYVPQGDKVARAHAAAPMWERGEVWFDKDAPYLSVLEHELLSFPGGAHDDQVDVLTSAIIIKEQKLYAHSVKSAVGNIGTEWKGAKELVGADAMNLAEQAKAKQRNRLKRKPRNDRSNGQKW